MANFDPEQDFIPPPHVHEWEWPFKEGYGVSSGDSIDLYCNGCPAEKEIVIPND